jgi:hypothetical protein
MISDGKDQLAEKEKQRGQKKTGFFEIVIDI